MAYQNTNSFRDMLETSIFLLTILIDTGKRMKSGGERKSVQNECTEAAIERSAGPD